jgi:hypothetical protein
MTRVLVISLSLAGLFFAACDGDSPPADGRDGGNTMPGSCTDYPEQFDIVTSGETFPPFTWTNASWHHGERLDFSLTEFFCSEDWAEYDSLLLVVGAGWCAACPPHAMDINAISSELRGNGTLVAYLLTQNSGGGLATGNEARAWVNSAIGTGWGLRLGDGENSEPGAIAQRANPVPTGYFIRKSDMMLLADENQVGVIPYTEISSDPTRNWPTELGVMFTSNCAAGTEEASEPNNTMDRAQVVSTETVIQGGVCDAAPDFYRIDVEGSWEVFLEYDMTDPANDLDIAVVNESGARVAQSGIDEMGRKSILFGRPQYVMISGPGRATAAYTLTVHPW